MLRRAPARCNRSPTVCYDGSPLTKEVLDQLVETAEREVRPIDDAEPVSGEAKVQAGLLGRFLVTGCIPQVDRPPDAVPSAQPNQHLGLAEARRSMAVMALKWTPSPVDRKNSSRYQSGQLLTRNSL